MKYNKDERDYEMARQMYWSVSGHEYRGGWRRAVIGYRKFYKSWYSKSLKPLKILIPYKFK